MSMLCSAMMWSSSATSPVLWRTSWQSRAGLTVRLTCTSRVTTRVTKDAAIIQLKFWYPEDFFHGNMMDYFLRCKIPSFVAITIRERVSALWDSGWIWIWGFWIYTTIVKNRLNNKYKLVNDQSNLSLHFSCASDLQDWRKPGVCDHREWCDCQVSVPQLHVRLPVRHWLAGLWGGILWI